MQEHQETLPEADIPSDQTKQTAPSDNEQGNQELQLLKEGINKEKEKYNKELEYKTRIQQLEKEKEEILSRFNTDEFERRETEVDVRSFFLENSQKYPLILATNADNLVSEELLKLKKTNKDFKKEDFFNAVEKIATEYESKIESYELKKAERLKKTPLFEKIYGVQPFEQKKSEKEKEKEKEKDLNVEKNSKHRASSNRTPLQTYENATFKKASPEEAHRIAYQAYLENIQNKSKK